MGRKYNILYIDDEYNNLVVFENAFFTYYNIFTAQSASEGLEKLEEEEIHLLITDQKMPGMTGIELLDKVKPHHPQLVTMIITAYSDIEIIIPAINRCGIFSYILKPWDSRDLKITMDNALNKYQLNRDNLMLLDNLKRSNEELEEKVKLRTRVIEEKNTELADLNAIKDKLFTVVSHDLRQPITSFSVFLETLKKLKGELDSEKFETITNSLQTQITEVKDLMDNLLNWSLLQMAGQKINLEKFNITEEVRKNIDLYNTIARNKGVLLKLAISNEVFEVTGDKEMSNMILRNLISNAVKFTEKDGEINCKLIQENGHVKVEVIDSGVGIPNETIKKLFTSKEHITSRGTENEKGIGIGLKLCKEFAEKQGGTIKISSKQGVGTNISFSLPQ